MKAAWREGRKATEKSRKNSSPSFGIYGKVDLADTAWGVPKELQILGKRRALLKKMEKEEGEPLGIGRGRRQGERLATMPQRRLVSAHKGLKP